MIRSVVVVLKEKHLLSILCLSLGDKEGCDEEDQYYLDDSFHELLFKIV